MEHWSCLFPKEQRFLLQVLCIYMLITGNEIDGCATVPRKDALSPVEQLLAAVNKAESQMENDAIILPKAPAEPVPVTVPKDLDVTIRKSPLKVEPEHDIPEILIGTMANFSCSQKRSGTNGSDTTILWRHHTTHIYTNATVPASSGSFFYSYSSVGQQSFLFVHNVSADAAGPVQCLQECDAGWCVVQEFQLRPQLRSRDVFYGILQNASSQCGGPISLTCRARMNCTPGAVEAKDKYYTWKVDDTFSGIPWEHSYLDELFMFQAIQHAQLRRNPFPPGVKQISIAAACSRSVETGVGFYEEVLTIVPQWPSWWFGSDWCPSPVPHRIQCWFRPYITGRRWLVQTAYAHYAQY